MAVGRFTDEAVNKEVMRFIAAVHDATGPESVSIGAWYTLTFIFMRELLRVLWASRYELDSISAALRERK